MPDFSRLLAVGWQRAVMTAIGHFNI